MQGSNVHYSSELNVRWLGQERWNLLNYDLWNDCINTWVWLPFLITRTHLKLLKYNSLKLLNLSSSSSTYICLFMYIEFIVSVVLHFYIVLFKVYLFLLLCIQLVKQENKRTSYKNILPLLGIIRRLRFQHVY